MQIWVDADACPNVIKDILFRAAERARISLILVANKPLRIPRSPFIRCMQVLGGIDVADNHIVDELQAGDLVITADIPLAAAVLERGAFALNPRGDLYTADNIRERLAVRDLMDTLRSSGINAGGPATLNLSDRQSFANQLDRLLSRYALTRKSAQLPD